MMVLAGRFTTLIISSKFAYRSRCLWRLAFTGTAQVTAMCELADTDCFQDTHNNICPPLDTCNTHEKWRSLHH